MEIVIVVCALVGEKLFPKKLKVPPEAPAFITCGSNNPNQLIWSHNGLNLRTDTILGKNYIVIPKMSEFSAGDYVCCEGVKSKLSVVGVSSLNIIEGNFLVVVALHFM